MVYDHLTGPKFREALTFAVAGSKTKLTMKMVFDTARERDATIGVFGAIEGRSTDSREVNDVPAHHVSGSVGNLSPRVGVRAGVSEMARPLAPGLDGAA